MISDSPDMQEENGFDIQPQESQNHFRGISNTYDNLRDADDILNEGKFGKKIDQSVENTKNNIKDKISGKKPDEKNSSKNGENRGFSQNKKNVADKIRDEGITNKNSAKLAGREIESGAKTAGAALTSGGATATEGAGVATAPETAGASLLVVEAGKAAKKGVREIKRTLKRGTHLRDFVDKADKKKKKVLAVIGCIILPILLLILGYIGIIAIAAKLLHLDTMSKAGQAIISIFHHNRDEGNISFTNPESFKAFEKGEISETVARLFTSYPPEKKPTFNFVGESIVIENDLQPNTFDLITYDVIKCTNGSDNIEPIKISLNPNFNWSSIIISGKENYLCAVGYYPGKDGAQSNSYSYLGPGEFKFYDIISAGPKATNQATADAINLFTKNNAEFVNDNSKEDISLGKLYLSSEIYNVISNEVIASLTTAYPNKEVKKIIKSLPSAGGVYFEFN